MEKQQTAVEWLQEKLIKAPKPIYNSEIDLYFEQAKELFRQQIWEAYITGHEHGNRNADSEKYFTPKYGK